MAPIAHQLAIFGFYNKSFSELYRTIETSFGAEIASFNINSMLDSPGVPPEIPRMEIVFKNGVRINGSRSRFDIFTGNVESSIGILQQLGDSIAYRDIYRFGSITTYFLTIEGNDIAQRVSQLFTGLPDKPMSEFGLRVNYHEEATICDKHIHFNHLQSIEMGFHNKENGYLYMQDINSMQDIQGNIPESIPDIIPIITESFSFFSTKRLVQVMHEQ